MKRTLVAEAIGTFTLVFAGTTAIVVNDLTHGLISQLGVALAFGLAVMAMIHAVGDISGAHLNPAVTFGFWIAGRFPRASVFPYVGSQLAGALAASLLVRGLFGPQTTLGTTLPAGAPLQALGLEIVMTALLMFTILSVSTGGRERGLTAGLAVGGVVALLALVGGPISGASMNPARSLAPALVSGELRDLWIYVAAPISGAALAVAACRSARGDACCGAAGAARSPTNGA